VLHDVFVDNVSKHDDEHGPHCTHMRWNCVKDDLHHAVPKVWRPTSFRQILSEVEHLLPHQHWKFRLTVRDLPGFSRIFTAFQNDGRGWDAERLCASLDVAPRDVLAIGDASSATVAQDQGRRLLTSSDFSGSAHGSAGCAPPGES
jgi:hypothetical protein